MMLYHGMTHTMNRKRLQARADRGMGHQGELRMLHAHNRRFAVWLFDLAETACIICSNRGDLIVCRDSLSQLPC